jgi:hypothetical protein
MVDRPTPKSSASSAWVWVPRSCSSGRCLVWFGFNFGCLPRSRRLALATFIPSRVPHPEQVGFELGDHGEHVEPQPAHRIGGVVD